MEEQNNATSEGTKGLTLGQRLAAIDEFTVDYAGRTDEGHLFLTSSRLRVTSPIPELFGQNIAELGGSDPFQQALDIAAESDEPEFHNFGTCTVRSGSLCKHDDGEWYVELSVPTRYRRKCEAFFERETLDDDGNVNGTEIVPTTKTEAWIMVKLTQAEPVLGTLLSATYLQRDRDTTTALNVNARSEKIAEGKTAQPRKKKGKSTRLSPAAAKALLAKRQG